VHTSPPQGSPLSSDAAPASFATELTSGWGFAATRDVSRDASHHMRPGAWHPPPPAKTGMVLGRERRAALALWRGRCMERCGWCATSSLVSCLRCRARLTCPCLLPPPCRIDGQGGGGVGRQGQGKGRRPIPRRCGGGRQRRQASLRAQDGLPRPRCPSNFLRVQRAYFNGPFDHLII
jgi:hypothetical protein